MPWIAGYMMRVMMLALVIGVASAHGAEESPCPEALYVGFDSRLTPHALGRVPLRKEPVQGFEIVNQRPLVSFAHRVVELRDKTPTILSTADTLTGLAVDDAGGAWFTSKRGILRREATQLTLDPLFTKVIEGKLHNSGSPVFLEAFPNGGNTAFATRRHDGLPYPILNAEGKLRAASWNSLGLAAVVGASLLIWEAGSERVAVLATDRGLEAARDVCLVGPGRAVVTLKHAIVLVTDQTQIVVAIFPARCRWSDGKLYLLDENTGTVWAVAGVEALGRLADDAAHTRCLVESLPRTALETSPAFLEAARLFGCKQARKWREEKTHTGP